MKTFFATLFACLALMQSAQAVESNLGESLREYQAILDASSLLATVIPESEFIVEIERKTRDLDATTVFYEIKTASFSTQHPNHFRTHEYRVKLLITPNPLIGPPVITVVSVTPERD